MTVAKTYLLSSSGQMSLPAGARRRWHLEKGGQVSVVDLGDIVVVAPGEHAFAGMLDAALSRDEHLEFVSGMSGDDDLATK